MTAGAVYEAILADDRLPSPGAVTAELLALTRQPEVAIEDIARVIATDPAICGRVMRAVNAPTARTRRQVTSIDQAVTVLGLRAVSGIAVAVSVLGRNRSGVAEFDYGAFWSGSLARAVAAKILADHTRRIPTDEAFTCGLLSHIGRLALVSVYPERYRRMLLTLGDSGAAELAEAERAVFEVDAEALSACMMRGWGMPAYHDGMTIEVGSDPARGQRERDVVHVCRVGGRVAEILLGSRVGRDQIAAAMQAMAELGIDAEVVAFLFPDIIAQYQEAGTDLQIRTPCVPSLAEIYAHAIDVP